MIESKKEAKQLGVLVVIPTYNNVGTISTIISEVGQYVDDILVVNDGSTDGTLELVQSLKNVKLLSYKKNRGKGYALRCALKYAYKRGYRYVITIDADGQHYPEDILNFIDKIKESPDTLIVGARNIEADNMPSKSTFANKFSNFWFMIETGQEMSDTQSGYRLYPIKLLQGVRFITPGYEFELEVIVRAVWRGIKVINMPVKVYYPPVEQRVSHFKPFRDFTRISLLNTILVTIALLYYYPKCFLKNCNYQNVRRLTDKHVLKTTDNNLKVAASIGLGIFFGIFPIWGYQMVVAGFSAHFLKLNKVIAVLASNISIGPMALVVVYASCVTGALLSNGNIDFELSQMSFNNMGVDVVRYVLGASVLAVVSGAAAAVISYFTMLLFKRKRVL